MSAIFEIYLRDESGTPIGMLEQFTSFEFVRRFNAAGSWVLEAPAEVLGSLTKKGGISVIRNGKPFFSGYVRAIKDDNGFTLTVSGNDDLAVIAKRLAYPVPAGAPFLTDFDVRTGLAEKVIKEYITVNAGSGATAARIIAGLSVEADYGRGVSVTGRARFDNLLTLAQSLARQGGIGIRVVDMEFQAYSPEDKTGVIVFDESLGTLGEYHLSVEAGAANYLICGGSGEGSARSFAEGGNPDAILSWGRSEAFLDKGSLALASEMVAAIQEELVKSSDKVALVFTPLITEKMVPMDHYDIGDWVKAIIRGETILKQVQELKVKIDPVAGEVVDLAIGTDGVSTDLTGFEKLFTTIKVSDSRVNTLERR